MAQIPNNVGPAGIQGAAKPSGISDGNQLLGFLSLLKIDGKPLGQAGTKDLADQIKKGLLHYGFSEADFPKLAISILRDRKAGKIDFPELPSEYLKKAKEEINYSSLPPELRSKVTHGRIQQKALTASSAETTSTKFAEVKLHPEPPRVEQYKSPVEQSASVLKVTNSLIKPEDSTPKEKGKIENPEKKIREFWRKHGHHSVIAAKHTEFTVEPKILIGDKLNPEILKLMVARYLDLSSHQDSGIGNIEYTGDKLTIKGDDGKPLVIVRDKKLIEQYLSRK